MLEFFLYHQNDSSTAEKRNSQGLSRLRLFLIVYQDENSIACGTKLRKAKQKQQMVAPIDGLGKD
jgi:hypothetical protein